MSAMFKKVNLQHVSHVQKSQPPTCQSCSKKVTSNMSAMFKKGNLQHVSHHSYTETSYKNEQHFCWKVVFGHYGDNRLKLEIPKMNEKSRCKPILAIPLGITK